MIPIEIVRATRTECDVAVGDILSRVVLEFQEVMPGVVRCMGKRAEHDIDLRVPRSWFLAARQAALRAMNEDRIAPILRPQSVSPQGCEVQVGQYVLCFEQTAKGLRRVGKPAPVSKEVFLEAYDLALAAVVGASQERISRERRRLKDF